MSDVSSHEQEKGPLHLIIEACLPKEMWIGDPPLGRDLYDDEALSLLWEGGQWAIGLRGERVFFFTLRKVIVDLNDPQAPAKIKAALREIHKDWGRRWQGRRRDRRRQNE